MRIVFLVKRFWPATGGVEKYVAELAHAVKTRGHRVSVVTGAHDAQLPDQDELNGITIHRFPALRSPLRCCWALSKVVQMFREADIVHVCDTEMLDYYWRMLGWRVVPRRLCMTLHGMSCVHPVPQHELVRARRARRLVDGMLHDGAFIGQWLNVDPDMIAPQGLRPTANEIVVTPEPARPSAIYVGRLEPDTGVELYFDALAMLRDRWRVDLPLHVYGSGSLAAKLAAQTNAQKLRVTFHGKSADAQERIADHTLAFVSGRMTIHEALARRRAVVAAFCNPIRADYVRGEAFSPYIATGGSGEEIAEQAHLLLHDDVMRRRITERGWRHVSELTWDKTAGAYLHVWTTKAPAPTRPTAWTHRARLAWRMWREAARANPSRDRKGADIGLKPFTQRSPDESATAQTRRQDACTTITTPAATTAVCNNTTDTLVCEPGE
ncbi:MAG: glycosyltransferase family 4 protein [Phycisphaerales bacterium]|nr:glycosyltransferase family 4 protein [Phycisphaerales bacterium]